jgi:hypothetical protein
MKAGLSLKIGNRRTSFGRGDGGSRGVENLVQSSRHALA